MCAANPQVAAVGVNCTAPEFISPLLAAARAQTDLPLIAYPNSGEIFDPAGKSWSAGIPHESVSATASAWVAAGADALGGCCRIGPDAIATLRGVLLD